MKLAAERLRSALTTVNQMTESLVKSGCKVEFAIDDFTHEVLLHERNTRVDPFRTRPTHYPVIYTKVLINL